MAVHYAPQPEPRPREPRRPGRGTRQSRGFYILLAAPGIIWLTVLFIVPFYAVLAIGEGKLNRLFESPVAVYNPLHWSSANLSDVWHDLFGSGSFAGPIVVRTVVYVAAASALCLVIGYPAAYFVSRFAGRRKGLFLVLLIAPFWISYMMRMLAWVNLLQNDGLVNRLLNFGGVFHVEVDWLTGQPMVVILGLAYGYVPYMILPLYAGLDRLSQPMLEASRDLGANRFSSFLRVTLPAISTVAPLMSSRSGVPAGK